MLGEFEELEKDIEQFQKNVLASTDLVDEIKAVTAAVKKNSEDTTLLLKQVSKEIQESNEKLKNELKRSLQDCSETISQNSARRMDEFISSFNEKQTKYFEQLSETQQELEGYRKNLRESQELFVKQVKEFDLPEIKRGISTIKSDFEKKINLVMVISAIAAVASIVSIFIK